MSTEEGSGSALPSALLPSCKTKIVCTVGPASDSEEVLVRLIHAGMSVVRLNFSHGDFDSHGRTIERVREAERVAGRRVAIMADLPGPKLRIGRLAQEPIELRSGQEFTLTVDEVEGGPDIASVSFERLPRVVKPGDALFLNDGFVQLEVRETGPREIRCLVRAGGELRSRKGLNLPGVDLGIRAFTDEDRRCLAFALAHGVDAVSQSFVEGAEDVRAVREAAAAAGYAPFVIAKMERARALDQVDAILEEADGVMIARGDLGVEIPIEQIALVQKRLMRKANRLGKPIITATQMLESMTASRRPTRAESTDVANAILDGTDCVMLSGESAMGRYPVEAVEMLARIAAAVEPHRRRLGDGEGEDAFAQGTRRLSDLLAWSVEGALRRVTPAAVFVPTRTGTTARNIARFRPPVWVVAVSSREATCRGLQFSCGVHPVHEPDHPDDWRAYARQWLCRHGMGGELVLLTEGPSSRHPDTNHRMELIDLGRPSPR